MPCDNSLAPVLDTVRPVGVPAAFTTGSPVTIMCTAWVAVASLQLAGPCSTFVHLTLFLYSIYVLPPKVIKRLGYSVDKDRVLCEVGAGLLL
jgi:hypothetical protein